MKIEGLSAGGGGGGAGASKNGTLVFVCNNIIWDVAHGKAPLLPALQALQQDKVLTSDPIKNRALNTKVLAFGWNRPKTADDLAKQRASLETHAGKLFKEIHAFDFDDIHKIDTSGEGKSNYLDGGEVVVQVARKYPERIEEVRSFVREPQRPDWIYDDLFEAALSHKKDATKQLAIYDAILAFPTPSASNRYRSTYVNVLNNALCVLNEMKDKKRAKELADRVRPFLKENPYLTHSSACAYAASGDPKTALEMIGLAVKFKYEKLDALKKDPDLAKVRSLPGYEELFGGGGASEKKKTIAAMKKTAKKTPKTTKKARSR